MDVLCLISWQESEPSSKPDDILESTVDAAEWNLELERVLPQLKVTVRSDNKVKAATGECISHHALCLSDRCVCCRTGGSMWTRCISTETESSPRSWRPRWVSERTACVGGWRHPLAVLLN